MAEASYWFREVPDERRFPPLEGNLRVDAAVLGGGIAGVSAAYFLSNTGKRVALLEMGRLVTGDSGYTTAFATHFLDSVPATVKAWQASEAGINLFRETIAKEQISCGWKDIDGIGFTKKDDASEFKKDAAAFRSRDPHIEYLEGNAATEAVGIPATAAYRKKSGEGQYHIRKFLLALAGAAKGNGAQIFEESEVREINTGSTITLKTDAGTVEADYLVVAAGPPPPQFFPKVFAMLTGAITFVINARFTAALPFTQSLLWDDLEPYHYFRWVNENELILGGEDRYLKGAPSGNPHEHLASWLESVSGGAPFEVVNKWQGSIFYTPDILPYMGPHPDYGQNVIFLTGWAGNGMAHGFLSGKIAADMVQRIHNPYQDLFSFNRSG